ncbi:nucleotide exchange factor GrpE [Candidatus Woesearchaeota archaeon]|nr:nucleotide exchange factor GrpE [Candidatus Woesearchaeota archaeon]
MLNFIQRLKGEKLDPYRHEVLMQEETADETKDGKVIEEFQKGYALNDVILRYSKVKVLKFAKVNGAEK